MTIAALYGCSAPVTEQKATPLEKQAVAAHVGEQTPTTSRQLPAGTHILHFTVDKLQRSYTVHVPGNLGAKQYLPVVIMLHGGGGTANAAIEETGWKGKAEEEGFLAVFPDAMSRDPSQRSSFARNPQLWNDGSNRFYSGEEIPDDVAFIDAVIDDLITTFPVDKEQIFVTGFSNGASMCFRVGAELSERIAAIAPVAGACWLDRVVLKRPVSMYYMTGTEDPLNAIEGGVPKLLSGGSDAVRAKAKPPVRDSISKWFNALDCPVMPANISDKGGIRVETYGPGRSGAEVIYVTVEGLGHTWAGGKSLLPESWVGKTTDKIRATDSIWDFFRTHPRKGLNQ
jgi:polyhydroxybutyrate depolymerase